MISDKYRMLTADDVLSDIEFELVQGAVSRDELGQGVRAIRRFQNKTRAEILDAKSQVAGSRDIAARQFQINDMLLTLLQEMIASLQSVRAELRRAIRFSQNMAPRVAVARAVRPVADSELGAAASFVEVALPDVDMGVVGRETREVEEAMRPEAIHVGLDVRATGLPILGGLIAWLKINLHSLSVFYVGRLVERQSSVNRTYGDWILHLQRLNISQQEQIEVLNAQVAALRARLDELEQSPLPPTRS